MSLKSRYIASRNVYEIGYYLGSQFIVVATQRAL